MSAQRQVSHEGYKLLDDNLARKWDSTIELLEFHINQSMAPFSTSSFQTHSIVLLDMLRELSFKGDIILTDTGYLFNETLVFAHEISSQFGLKLVKVKSSTPKSMQRDIRGNLIYSSNPDWCCQLNKVDPLNSVLHKYDLWVNGIRADQSANRAGLKTIETTTTGTTRFHPLLTWSSKEIHQVTKRKNLPKHPLHDQMISIGCRPCTRDIKSNITGRDGRWFGLNKTECGLNTHIIGKPE